jgi:hypothetical protein
MLFARVIAETSFADDAALHRWNIIDPGAFWSALRHWAGVTGDLQGPALVGEDIFAARFFPEPGGTARPRRGLGRHVGHGRPRRGLGLLFAGLRSGFGDRPLWPDHAEASPPHADLWL